MTVGKGIGMTIDRRGVLKAGVAAAGATLAAPLVMRHAALGADPIKLVGIHDASGGLDIYGQPMVACLEFAVDEANAAGGLLGRELQLINYDPQSNIQLYTQFATEAATKDKAAVVLGGITSASREAIRPILRRFNTLYFYNTQYEGGVCDRNCFCTGSTPAQNVQKLVPYVQKNWGKKIYIVAADYNYGQITAKWITKYTREGGGEVLAADFFPLDVTEFGPAISKIQAAKPDAVISALVGGDAYLVLPPMGRGGDEEADPDGVDHLRQRQREHPAVARGRRRHCQRLQLFPGSRQPAEQGVPGEIPRQARGRRRRTFRRSCRCAPISASSSGPRACGAPRPWTG